MSVGIQNGIHNGNGHNTNGHKKARIEPKLFDIIDSEDHFRLDIEFLRQYKGKKPKFGFNGLGEFVFYRTYSRVKADGSKESFMDTIKRVVEGCYEIQRRHCRKIHVPWDYDKAQVSAQEMFERIWDFKLLPPGRGLWMMGTEFMWRQGGSALNNCGFVSTKDLADDPAEPFCFLMDMTMLGVGVGFDMRGADKLRIVSPFNITNTIIIDDSREGWVDSVRQLICSFTTNPELGDTIFNYSVIRPAGSPIKGFGGKASGPQILEDLHVLMKKLLRERVGKFLSSVDIVDLMNFIGKCIVAGNVRRSSEIAFGEFNDAEYFSMKNPVADLNDEERQYFYSVTGPLFEAKIYTAYESDFVENKIPADKLLKAISKWNDLNSHRWASNNSIYGYVGMDYSNIGAQIAVNGEPGIAWLDTMRDYGRIVDGRKPGIDGRVLGGNPCLEQSLESYELCCLVETFPNNHNDASDYLRTLKFAYLYAKTVTLLPTHCSRTNAVMLRNRRIGLSQSGIVQAFQKFGRRSVLQDFCDAGYNEVKRWDEIYSDWLCIPKSIKVTSVKPSGSVSLLAGATPGIHHPEASTYWRRVRISKDSILIKIMQEAGYHVEQAATDASTMIIKFAISDERVRPVEEISMFEQLCNAADYQTYWADNQVSCTIKFKQDEASSIPKALSIFEDRLKGISFLPWSGHGYTQAPYEPCSVEEVIEYNSKLKDVDFSDYIYEGVGSAYCDGDQCQSGL